MTTPPSSLVDRLPSNGMIALRLANGQLDRSITITDAIALAVRGSIEGVGPRNGRILFVRWLKDEARPGFQVIDACGNNEIDTGRSTAFTSNSMGVYREPVRQPIVVENAWGKRMAVASGDIVGHVFAHCGISV